MHSDLEPTWRHNRPSLAHRNSVAGLSVALILGVAAAGAFAAGSVLWLALLLVLAITSLPFVLIAYWTGPASGWRGAWSLRVAKVLDDVRPTVLRALEDARIEFRVSEPVRAPRWLRNASILVQIREGFRIWLVPGLPGGSAGLSPRLQPLTTVVVDSSAVIGPHNTRRLRGLLAEQLLAPAPRHP